MKSILLLIAFSAMANAHIKEIPDSDPRPILWVTSSLMPDAPTTEFIYETSAVAEINLTLGGNVNAVAVSHFEAPKPSVKRWLVRQLRKLQ